MRMVTSDSANTADGSTWQYASVLGTYSDRDLKSILPYLRTAVQNAAFADMTGHAAR